MASGEDTKILEMSKDFVILFGTLVLVAFFLPRISSEIGRLLERKHIYSSSRERIEKAGGWKSVEQACLNFATNEYDPKDESVFYYFHGKRISTNSLPPVFNELQPMFLSLTKDQNGVPIFQVFMSCGHRTGTYDTPYYGIWVVCTNSPNYIPAFGSHLSGAQGIIERKGDSIFEAR